MRKLLYIFIVLLTFGMPSCKTTTKVVTMHDTLTIERLQEVRVHDTLTITSTEEAVVERVIYDTLERVKEVVRVDYRTKYLQEQGATQVMHDTITIQQTQQATSKQTTPKHSNVPAILLVLVLVGIIGYIGFKVNK